MINPDLHVNKSFRDQVENFMCNSFGELAKPFIKATLSKKNIIVLGINNVS